MYLPMIGARSRFVCSGTASGRVTSAVASALQYAIITRPDAVPERVKKDLAPIIGRYMK